MDKYEEAKLILDVRISRFDHASDINGALEVAKEALEKQIVCKAIPHKVDMEELKIGNVCWGKGTTVYQCKCGEWVSPVFNYCTECGQKLK